jgi:hypothetical protein
VSRFIIPILQSWVRSGDFNPWSKLYNAVKDNVIYYGVLAVIGVVFLVYMIVAVKFEKYGMAIC